MYWSRVGEQHLNIYYTRLLSDRLSLTPLCISLSRYSSVPGTRPSTEYLGLQEQNRQDGREIV